MRFDDSLFLPTRPARPDQPSCQRQSVSPLGGLLSWSVACSLGVVNQICKAERNVVRPGRPTDGQTGRPLEAATGRPFRSVRPSLTPIPLLHSFSIPSFLFFTQCVPFLLFPSFLVPHITSSIHRTSLFSNPAIPPSLSSYPLLPSCTRGKDLVASVSFCPSFLLPLIRTLTPGPHCNRRSSDIFLSVSLPLTFLYLLTSHASHSIVTALIRQRASQRSPFAYNSIPDLA